MNSLPLNDEHIDGPAPVADDVAMVESNRASDVQDGLELDGVDKPTNKRQRRLTSNVWSNYTFLEEPSPEGLLRCECKKCKQVYNVDSKHGTGNFKRHTATCLKRTTYDIGQQHHSMNWIKAKLMCYPELALMTRDVLSVPISTVASESAFSTGGRVLDQYRSSMKPEVVEALICTKDWFFGERDPAQNDLEDIIENMININVDQDGSTMIDDDH